MIALADIDLVLASTSRYRRDLLTRLTPGFRTLAPEVDETPFAGETPAATAMRLAVSKARAIAACCPGALVIGSDQVAEIDGQMLGKPGSAEAACAQLTASSGRSVEFHTALCLIDSRAAVLHESTASDTTRVIFRDLASAEIARYVVAEQPLDCAGSFKVEGLGIALFERIESSDPTALIGLPLIALARLLRAAGIAIP
ncbi:MAG: Maf family nucleotide pyrophosphatase [Dokdonella sp.]